MASVKAPGWLGKAGPGRILSEFRALTRARLQGVTEVTLVDDDITVWRFKITSFDSDIPAGRQLNADLATLGRLHGPDAAAVVLEARFPDRYPSEPFFLRVVRPRMVMYSGHVTAGGSVCIEALTQSGGEGAWRSDLCVESVLAMVLYNMLNCQRVEVRTAAGGGVAGPLRIDMSRGRAALQEYGMAEAQAAFHRTLANHGWSHGARGGGGAAAAAAAAPARHAPVPWAARPHPPPAPASQAAAVPQPRQRAPAAPAAAVAAAAAGPSRKRLPEPEVICLLDSEDEDDEGEAAAIAAGPSRSGGSGRGDGRAAKRPAQATLAAARPAAAGRPAQDLSSSTQAAAPRQRQRAVAVAAAVAAAVSEEELQRAANSETGLDLRPAPLHWRVTDELRRGVPQVTPLPLPGQKAVDPEEKRKEAAIAEVCLNGCSRAEAVEALAACGGDVDKCLEWLMARQMQREAAEEPGALGELLANGLSQEDAAAALRHARGDVVQALLYSIECQDAGGPAAVERRAGRGAPAAAHAIDPAEAARQAEQEAERRAMLAEAEAVMRRFSEHGGLEASRIVGIDRVESLVLWSDYVRCKAKVARDAARAGAGVNEQRLWHGADKETLCIIVNEGFDHRVSNLSGALGAGNYFARSSTYSDAYSRTAKHSAEAISGAARYGGYPYGAYAGAAGGGSGLAGGMWAQAYGGGAYGAAVYGGSYAGGARGAAQQPQQPAPRHGHSARPSFRSDCVSMLLCDVTLGVEGTMQPGMRRPAAGCHSTGSASIYAVYDNHQAYPTHIIHYR